MEASLRKRYKIAAVDLGRWLDQAPDIEIDEYHPRSIPLDTRTKRASNHEPPLGQADTETPGSRVPALSLSTNAVIQYQMEEIMKWYASGGMYNRRRATPSEMAENVGLSLSNFKEMLASIQNKMGMMFKGSKILDEAAKLAELSLMMALEERAIAMEIHYDMMSAGEYRTAVQALSAATSARKGTLDRFTDIALKNTGETQDNQVTIVLPAFLARKSGASGMMTSTYDPEKKVPSISIDYDENNEETDAIDIDAEEA